MKDLSPEPIEEKDLETLLSAFRPNPGPKLETKMTAAPWRRAKGRSLSAYFQAATAALAIALFAMFTLNSSIGWWQENTPTATQTSTATLKADANDYSWPQMSQMITITPAPPAENPATTLANNLPESSPLP